MIVELKKKVSAFKQNLGGFTTNRKIVVIESDDWGSVRMPNKEAYKSLLEKGIPVNRCSFLKYDGFEQAEDFECLSKVMLSIKDNYGKIPKITANYIMSNPDFKAIRDSEFSVYHYESLVQKLEREGLLQSYKKDVVSAQSDEYFHPQLHGREHINAPLWLRFLKANSKETHIAFEREVYGISTTITTEKRRSFLPALDYENETEFKEFTQIALKEGQALFQDFFGYKSRSFIAPNYTWDNAVESVLKDIGVQYIQSSRNQFISLAAQIDGIKNIKHKLGETNKLNQTYIVRNAIFEPSTVSNKQMCFQDCYNQISMAFLTKKPAVISMHRLNFMGSLVAQNRTDNLQLFKQLMVKLIEKWPEVEFMTTDELGDLIKTQKNA